MFKELNHKAYIVGGAVRDELMGIKPSDIDYAIEATEEEFSKVFPDALKVGNSFPVFLINGHEVALTRKEKSTGPGYTEFAYEPASLTEDLGRRDFTINSIAKSYLTGELIDPYGGVEDIKNKVIRSINPYAFTEDPLRIYRAARFAARFWMGYDESVYEQAAKAIDFISTVNAERVEKELYKVYQQCSKPAIFFEMLKEIHPDVLKVHFAPLDALCHVTAGPAQHHYGKTAFAHTMDAINRCAQAGYDFPVFVSVLCHDFGKATTPPEILPSHYDHEDRSLEIATEWLKEHRFDKRTQDLVKCVTEKHMKVHKFTEMRSGKLMRFYRGIRGNMRQNYLQACHCDHPFTKEQGRVIEALEDADKYTIVGEIPEHIIKQGTPSVVEWVNQRYTSTFMRLIRKEEE